MNLNLERNDYLVIAGSIVIPLLGGILSMGIESQMTMAYIIIAMTIAAGLAIIAAVAAIYKGRGMYGGDVARYLELIAIGFILFILSYIPHTLWHVMGLPEALGPGWGLFSSAWWAGFYHIGAIMFFLISVYGFYLFWRTD
jgi:hypothetical protein